MDEEEREEDNFRRSRKLSRVSMSKSILLSEGFTVAVLGAGVRWDRVEEVPLCPCWQHDKINELQRYIT